MPANNLRNLRQERGFTLDGVIERLPVGATIDRRMLSKLELGQRALSPERAAWLAAAFGVDPADLVTDRPPPRS